MRFVLKTPKRADQSTHDVYSGSQKAPKKEEKTKRYSLPQTNPNQSMKSTMDINLSPINSLVQVNKYYTKTNYTNYNPEIKHKECVESLPYHYPHHCLVHPY